MHLNLHQDAILVADAHAISSDGFFDFLNKIDNGEIETTQLILFGDIFELLFGDIEYFINANKDSIDLINKLSLEIDIYYLEGNHDFNLSKIFPKINIYSIKHQPVNATYQDKNILLSHGDNYQKLGYKVYTSVIRNEYVLKFLNFVDRHINNRISKKLTQVVPAKERYNKIKNFKQIVENRVQNYDTTNIDYIIEGHYHQNISFDFDDFKYVNLPAFKSSGRYLSLSDII